MITQFHAREEQKQDLLVNLFNGDKSCEDMDFVGYIKETEDIHEEVVQVLDQSP